MIVQRMCTSISECLFCKNFLGGMPPDPLEGLRFALHRCASHTRIQHLCLTTMQFQKWPTKFGFYWPFRPNNNFSLYCTLHTRTHTRTHHTHTHTHIHAHMHTHTHTHTHHTHTRTRTHTHTACTRYAHTLYTHTHTHTHTHSYTYTYTRTHTYIHKHA